MTYEECNNKKWDQINRDQIYLRKHSYYFYNFCMQRTNDFNVINKGEEMAYTDKNGVKANAIYINCTPEIHKQVIKDAEASEFSSVKGYVLNELLHKKKDYLTIKCSPTEKFMITSGFRESDFKTIDEYIMNKMILK